LLPSLLLCLFKLSRDWKSDNASDNVFVVTAHDLSLYDVLEYFPAGANEWKVKGWKERGRWKYLADFSEAVRAAETQG